MKKGEQEAKKDIGNLRKAQNGKEKLTEGYRKLEEGREH